MNSVEKRLVNANIELQDENKCLKIELAQIKKLIEELKTYITVNKDSKGNLKAESLLSLLEDYYNE